MWIPTMTGPLAIIMNFSSNRPWLSIVGATVVSVATAIIWSEANVLFYSEKGEE